MSGTPGDVGRLLRRTLLYGGAGSAGRLLTFLMLPLYTRWLSTEEYGLAILASTVASVLVVIFPLGLHGAFARFHFSASHADEARRRSGSIWLGALCAAIALALLTDQVGAPLIAWLVPSLPFSPYGRLAVWLAVATVATLLPLTLLQTLERARTNALISVAGAAVTTVLMVLLVSRGGGALGYLAGMLAGSLFTALVASLVVARDITRPRLDAATLRSAIGYGLPLVPHSLASWVLELSDRAILSRFVSLSAVGAYGVGYQLGSAVSLVASGFGAAWIPILFRGLADGTPGARLGLARLATWYVAGLAFLCVGWALSVDLVVRQLLAPGYGEAWRISRWVILGQLFNGLYLLPVNLLFWHQKTRLIPLVTLVAGAVNLALNFWLIPTAGAIAAAWSTAIAYAVMALLAGLLARRIDPFPFEYGRIAGVLLAAAACVAIGALVPFSRPWLAVPIRIGACALFPAFLVVSGFVPRASLGSWRRVRPARP